MNKAFYPAPRSALFLPASNPRAIAKARTLAADMIILDLEDAVRPEDKAAARAAVQEAAGTFGDRPVGIRVNGEDSDHWADDLRAVKRSGATHVVVPKVETAETLSAVAWRARRPILAMIETPAAVMNLGPIASVTLTGLGAKLAGLIVGTNDLASGLKLPTGTGREAMAAALQLTVLAARARDLWVLDGVCNALDDAERLAAECRDGRSLGFDGKTLIHPTQVEAANRIFSPTDAELDRAEALVAAATGGAERHEGEMIEAMHVDAARALLTRAGRG